MGTWGSHNRGVHSWIRRVYISETRIFGQLPLSFANFGLSAEGKRRGFGIAAGDDLKSWACAAYGIAEFQDPKS